MSTIARAVVPLPRSEEEKGQLMELYERYGSMAYGIILRIVPQPELAQAVLVDLFATLSVEMGSDKTERVSALIIRTARRKALASRLGSAERSLTSFQPTERNLPKVVFNLAFWHGCHVTEIADRLNIATTDVLRAIRAYVKSFTVA
jgi:DNA-directed RNA polymerase specialized sigma24 family protein